MGSELLSCKLLRLSRIQCVTVLHNNLEWTYLLRSEHIFLTSYNKELRKSDLSD